MYNQFGINKSVYRAWVDFGDGLWQFITSDTSLKSVRAEVKKFATKGCKVEIFVTELDGISNWFEPRLLSAYTVR